MASQKKTRRRIILVVVLAILGYGFYYLWVRIPVVNGYAAKNLCSCVFIDGRTPDDVINNELDYSFVKYASAEVDLKKKTASASFLGMRSRTAYFHEDFGCAVLDEDKRPNVQFVKGADSGWPEFLKDTLAPQYDQAKLKQVVAEHFFEKKPEEPWQTRAVLVVYKGHIIAEQYAEGFDKDSKHLGWSMTKSIFNALVGIQVKRGLLSTQDKMPFEEWKGTDRENITWDDVLRMNTGIQWTEDYGNPSEVTGMLYEDNDDMLEYILQLGMEAEAGNHWEYSSGMSNLLSGGLRRLSTSDQAYWEMPYKELFNKLGMSSMIMETDGQGLYVGSSYSWATARDWAKFGMLYLNRGNWNGEQLFDPSWVDYSVSEVPGSEGRYGAQWWRQVDNAHPDLPKDMYYADGFQGQRIYVFPSNDLVVVRLGLSKFDQPAPMDFNHFLKGILEAIQP